MCQNTCSQEVKAPVILTGTAGSNPVACQGRLQQIKILKEAGGRWFKSNHRDDEIALLSEPKPPPKGGQGEIIIVGVAQWIEHQHPIPPTR